MARGRLLGIMVGLVAMIAPASAHALSIDPTAYDWGNVDRYQQSGWQTFKVTNDSADPTTIQSVGFDGGDAGSFQIPNQDCNGAYLENGWSCSVTVYVQPQQVGALVTNLVVTDGDAPAIAPLSAFAQTGTLNFNPNPVNFNPQPWFFGSQFQNLNVQNNNYGIQISNVAIEGSDASLFSLNYQGCTGYTLNAGSSCRVGIQFNPSQPVVADDAALVITSDSASSPDTIPLNATALSGPDPVADPDNFDFGPTKIGTASASKTFTIGNDGDYPAQIQQVLVVTGSVQSFPVLADDCSGAIVMPGDDCTFKLAFSPHATGVREASIFLIANTPGPVTQIGISGEGYQAPGVAASISGTPAVGDQLSCDPSGATGELSYAWLRSGAPIGGADARTYTPDNADVGASLACRITATNPLGSDSANSPPTPPTAPRDLSDAPHSLVGASACRVVGVEPIKGYEISGTSPATPEAPLTFTRGSKSSRFTPRKLAKLADGPQVLSVDGRQVPVTLAPCRLSVRATGASDDRAELALSAAAGMKSGQIRTPDLAIDHRRGGQLGEAIVYTHGEPDSRFPLSRGTTSYNGVKVTLSRHGVKVKGLPADSGTVQIRLRRGVVSGEGGTIKGMAKVAGSNAKAASVAIWN